MDTLNDKRKKAWEGYVKAFPNDYHIIDEIFACIEILSESSILS